MRVDLHTIDPWASRHPRLRDWLVAGLGAVLLASGGLAVWRSAGASAETTTPVDAVEWQITLDRSQRLNRVLEDLSHPWSRQFERALRVTADPARLERFEGDAATGRLELVLTQPDLARAGDLVDELADLPGAKNARLARHEAVSGGVRIHVEVGLAP